MRKEINIDFCCCTTTRRPHFGFILLHRRDGGREGRGGEGKGRRDKNGCTSHRFVSYYFFPFPLAASFRGIHAYILRAFMLRY